MPLAEKIPEVTSFTYRHYLPALRLAGRLAAAGDVPNFPAGGVTMLVARD